MVLQNPCAHFTLYQGSPPRPHHDAFLHIFQVLVCIAPASARLFLTTLCKTSAPPARIVLLLVLFFLHGNENCLFPPLGDLPDPGIELIAVWQADSLPLSHLGTTH